MQILTAVDFLSHIEPTLFSLNSACVKHVLLHLLLYRVVFDLLNCLVCFWPSVHKGGWPYVHVARVLVSSTCRWVRPTLSEVRALVPHLGSHVYHRQTGVSPAFAQSVHRFVTSKKCSTQKSRSLGENSCFTFRWAEGVNWLDGTVA